VSKVTVLRLTGYFCRDAFEDVVDGVQDGHGSLEMPISGVVGGPLRLKGSLAGLVRVLCWQWKRAISTSWRVRWQGGVELMTTFDS
jgi:hypothetical protein